MFLYTYFINQSQPDIISGLRMAMITSFKNFVKTPGAGAHPKGRPIAIKNSPSILN